MVLEKQILMFLNIAHNSVKQCMSEVFQRGGFNLTPEQFLVMDTLWDEGVLTQQQIADITMRDKNSIVKLIDGLENRKLVRRVSNPKDRRQNLIKVTPYSRKIKDAVTELSLEAVATIVGDIPRKSGVVCQDAGENGEEHEPEVRPGGSGEEVSYKKEVRWDDCMTS